MKEIFTALVFKEEGWHIAQCVELDIASQGNDEAESLINLKEALTLHMMAPSATLTPSFCDDIEGACQNLGLNRTSLREINLTNG